MRLCVTALVPGVRRAGEAAPAGGATVTPWREAVVNDPSRHASAPGEIAEELELPFGLRTLPASWPPQWGMWDLQGHRPRFDLARP